MPKTRLTGFALVYGANPVILVIENQLSSAGLVVPFVTQAHQLVAEALGLIIHLVIDLVKIIVLSHRILLGLITLAEMNKLLLYLKMNDKPLIPNCLLIYKETLLPLVSCPAAGLKR